MYKLINLKKKLTKLKRNQLMILIFAAVFIGVLATAYFIYYRSRRTVPIYISGMVLKNINIANTPATWVPFWMADAIKEGDRDYSQLGRINALVLNKESLTDRLNGKQVNLELNVFAIKDRLGLLLYKNKPLSTGGMIELRLPKTTINLLITDISEEKPVLVKKKIIVNTLFKFLDPWQTELIKVGNEITNNNGEVLAKILDKKVSFAEVSGENTSGQKVITSDNLRRDMTVALILTVTQREGDYYFFGYQKIWPNQNLYLPWPGGELYHNIISVTPADEEK